MQVLTVKLKSSQTNSELGKYTVNVGKIVIGVK